MRFGGLGWPLRRAVAAAAMVGGGSLTNEFLLVFFTREEGSPGSPEH